MHAPGLRFILLRAKVGNAFFAQACVAVYLLPDNSNGGCDNDSDSDDDDDTQLKLITIYGSRNGD